MKVILNSNNIIEETLGSLNTRCYLLHLLLTNMILTSWPNCNNNLHNFRSLYVGLMISADYWWTSNIALRGMDEVGLYRWFIYCVSKNITCLKSYFTCRWRFYIQTHPSVHDYEQPFFLKKQFRVFKLQLPDNVGMFKYIYDL